MNDASFLDSIDLDKLGIVFDDKPILIGGMALEFFGIRKHGEDVDFIVSGSDYKKLENKYRDCRKDRWGERLANRRIPAATASCLTAWHPKTPF
jgi:hypothetical protein